MITTPNPEHIMLARKDRKLKNVLNQAEISLPDGVGLAAATKFNRMTAPEVPLVKPLILLIKGVVVGASVLVNKKWLYSELKPIHGRKMFLKLVDLANKKKWRLVFLGGVGEVAPKSAEILRKKYKKVEILAFTAPSLDQNGKIVSKEDLLKQKRIVDKINKFKPHLVFAGFGAPKQEKWLAEWLPKLSAGGGMVVGGTFDYIAELHKLPPKWMSDIELEWLWRLMTQPRRLKRILTAFPLFPLVVYQEKVREKN